MADEIPSAEFVIIGAGVFGLSTALHLARRGHSVAVFEAHGIPAEDEPAENLLPGKVYPGTSVGVSRVVRADYGDNEVYTDLMVEALSLWREWNAQQARPLFHETGWLVLTKGHMRPDSFEGKSFATLSRRGFPLRRVDPGTFARDHPQWAWTDVDGYFNPHAGWAENGRVVGFMARTCRAAGVRVFDRTPVAELLRGVHDPSIVLGVRTADGRVCRTRGPLRADDPLAPRARVIVCSGAWTPRVVPQCAPLLKPVAQPLVFIRPSRPEKFQPPAFTVFGAATSQTGYYGFPLIDGTVKIGRHSSSGLRQTLDDPRVPPSSEKDRFLAFVRATFPDLHPPHGEVTDARVCFYCDTFDSNFLIDTVPGCVNLAVAAGGSGHGFKFAPVIGRVVADILFGAETPAARMFQWREPSRGDGVGRDGARAKLEPEEPVAKL